MQVLREKKRARSLLMATCLLSIEVLQMGNAEVILRAPRVISTDRVVHCMCHIPWNVF